MDDHPHAKSCVLHVLLDGTDQERAQFMASLERLMFDLAAGEEGAELVDHRISTLGWRGLDFVGGGGA